MIGLLLGAAGSLIAAFAPTIEWVTFGRFVQSAGCAAGMVIGWAMVQDQFPGPERTRVMAYIGMELGLSPTLATVLGG